MKEIFVRVSEKLNHVRALELLNDVDDELKLKLKEIAEGKRGRDWRTSERVMTQSLWTDQRDAVGDLKNFVSAHRSAGMSESAVTSEPLLPPNFRFDIADRALARVIDKIGERIDGESALQDQCDEFDVLNELKEYLDIISALRG